MISLSMPQWCRRTSCKNTSYERYLTVNNVVILSLIIAHDFELYDFQIFWFWAYLMISLSMPQWCRSTSCKNTSCKRYLTVDKVVMLSLIIVYGFNTVFYIILHVSYSIIWPCYVLYYRYQFWLCLYCFVFWFVNYYFFRYCPQKLEVKKRGNQKNRQYHG